MEVLTKMRKSKTVEKVRESNLNNSFHKVNRLIFFETIDSDIVCDEQPLLDSTTHVHIIQQHKIN